MYRKIAQTDMPMIWQCFFHLSHVNTTMSSPLNNSVHIALLIEILYRPSVRDKEVGM